jgi:hypothetical protein
MATDRLHRLLYLRHLHYLAKADFQVNKMRSDWHERTEQSKNSKPLYRYRLKKGAWVAGVFNGEEDMGLGPAWRKRLLFILLSIYATPIYLYLTLARPLKEQLAAMSPDEEILPLPLRIKRKKAAFASAALFILPCTGIVILASLSPSEDKTIGGLRAPKIGETMFVGRTNCDKAVKNILLDPGSYEQISTQIVDVKTGEGWVAQVDFRSRNRLGAYGTGTAYCVFDGQQYRALLQE